MDELSAPANDAIRDVVSAESQHIAWRELQCGLWVGRAGGVHVAKIERGKQYTLSDPEERLHLGFQTLAAAQEAATGPLLVIVSSPDPPPPSSLIRTTVLGLSGIVVLALTLGGLVALVLTTR